MSAPPSPRSGCYPAGPNPNSTGYEYPPSRRRRPPPQSDESFSRIYPHAMGADSTDLDTVVESTGQVQIAPTPASATVWSCSPLPLLTPIAPMTIPSRRIGMPPAKIMMRP
jgi:hypothetical protein